MSFYAISHLVQASPVQTGVGDGTPMLLDADDTGIVDASPFTASDVSKHLEMVNDRLFSVWTVPPQGMTTNGPDGGLYQLGNWRIDGQGSVPPEATVLTFYDDTSGALDSVGGLFKVPVSGLYRHSMYAHFQTIGHTNFGIFVQINGLRHVGNFARTPEDVVFGDCAHFATELWHQQDDEIGFLCGTSYTDTTTNGYFAHWTVSLSYDSASSGIPRDGVARRSLLLT
jgi:hypothetical protein